ncbi:hypothetical protein L210DRAFT_3419516 [Boletus edulis BED1]|uniref:Protein-S-isoprenylcysteine O-methyltransferase n=1 Tax=Boletus edulis BED1 TaxID=1328754 RepID=A0AAD4BGW5_BOLED|nr:hypothetical protein L210DRAFT_3419516 [Boletus edulis BED1]
MFLFVRAALILVQALSNHRAFLPPNKTPEKGRYHTEEPQLLQIAPSIFKLHNVLLWCIAVFEVVYALNHYFGATFSPSLSARLDTAICPIPRSHVVTPLFVMGVLTTVVGMLIRIQCFRELGQLFTFDLSILPGHKLVTSGCYGYVRHPSYTGSMLIVAGLAFSHLTAGSLAVECSILGPIGSLLLCVAWWMWTLSVGASRAIAEDKELQKLFGPEWDAYAATTKFWFVPGFC